MNRKRVKAFTLIEVVLAMMLAAIVMGMAYAAFTIFNRLYGDYRLKNLAYTEVQVLKHVLMRDMERALLVKMVDGQVNFRDATGTSNPVYTIFQDDLLRSNTLVVDTFRMPDLKMRCFFEGSEVSSGTVDQLVLNFNYADQPMVISVTKFYSSGELFNQQSAITNESNQF